MYILVHVLCKLRIKLNVGDVFHSGYEFRSVICNNHHCPVDGMWEEWLPWQPCTASCGAGTSSRSRFCWGPFHEGQPCVGRSSETEHCMIEECAAKATIAEHKIEEEAYTEADQKPTSKAIGSGGIIAMLILLIVLIVIDSVSFLNSFVIMRRNLKDGFLTVKK